MNETSWQIWNTGTLCDHTIATHQWQVSPTLNPPCFDALFDSTFLNYGPIRVWDHKLIRFVTLTFDLYWGQRSSNKQIYTQSDLFLKPGQFTSEDTTLQWEQKIVFAVVSLLYVVLSLFRTNSPVSTHSNTVIQEGNEKPRLHGTHETLLTVLPQARLSQCPRLCLMFCCCNTGIYG